MDVQENIKRWLKAVLPWHRTSAKNYSAQDAQGGRNADMPNELLAQIAGAATGMHQVNEFLAKLWRVSRAVLAHFGLFQFEPKGRNKRGSTRARDLWQFVLRPNSKAVAHSLCVLLNH